MDILSKLSLTSLVQFKLVCKAWSAMAHDPLLVDMHISGSSGPANSCLILHCDSPIRNQLYFVDLVADDEVNKVRKLYAPFQSKMPEFDVVGSCNGLLCLADTLFHDQLYVYNPLSLDQVQLPKSNKYPEQEAIFGFGFHPKTREYKLVKIVYYRNKLNAHKPARRIVYSQSDVQVFTLGASAWRSLGKVSYQFVRRSSEALVNGRLHWVTRPRRYNPTRRLISFDLADEQFKEIPKPDCGGLNQCNYHLTVLNGCLAAAVMWNYGKVDIWVMKEYNMKESWVNQYTIGAYTPKALKHNLERPAWKQVASNGRNVRVIRVLENGEVLLEYRSRVLVSFNPKNGKFKDLAFQAIPKWFQTVAHVGSFNWFNIPKER